MDATTSSATKPAPQTRQKQAEAAVVAGSAEGTPTAATPATQVDSSEELGGQQAVNGRRTQLAVATRRIVNQMAGAAATSAPAAPPASLAIEQPSARPQPAALAAATDAPVSASARAPAAAAASRAPKSAPRIARRRAPQTATASDAHSSTPVSASTAQAPGKREALSPTPPAERSVRASAAVKDDSQPTSTGRAAIQLLFRQQPASPKAKQASATGARPSRTPRVGPTTRSDILQLMKPLPAASATSPKEILLVAVQAAQKLPVLDLDVYQDGPVRALQRQSKEQQAAAAGGGEADNPSAGIASAGLPARDRYYSERSNRRYQYSMLLKRKVKQPLPAAALAALAAPLDNQEASTFFDTPTFLPSGPRKSQRGRPFSANAGRRSTSMFLPERRRTRAGSAGQGRGEAEEAWAGEVDPLVEVRAQFELRIQYVIQPVAAPESQTFSTNSSSSSRSSMLSISPGFSDALSSGSRSSLCSVDFADDLESTGLPAHLGGSGISSTSEPSDGLQQQRQRPAAPPPAEDEELDEDEEAEEDADSSTRLPSKAERKAGYDSRVEAINDVVQMVLGTKLPENAFYGQRAVTLAVLRDEDVKASCGLWQSALGPDFAAAFIGREGTLLLRHPTQMLQLFDALSASLGLLPQQCVKFALQHPFLVSWYNTDRDLEALLTKLGEVLQVDRLKATRIIMHSPRLALLTKLGEVLQVDRLKVTRIIMHSPRLVSGSSTNPSRP
ncbi:MAG: hypothetical protein WDW36_004192 [Sanguina aurantia]